jgi:hypothetical protein
VPNEGKIVLKERKEERRGKRKVERGGRGRERERERERERGSSSTRHSASGVLTRQRTAPGNKG